MTLERAVTWMAAETTVDPAYASRVAEQVIRRLLPATLTGCDELALALRRCATADPGEAVSAVWRATPEALQMIPSSARAAWYAQKGTARSSPAWSLAWSRWTATVAAELLGSDAPLRLYAELAA